MDYSSAIPATLPGTVSPPAASVAQPSSAAQSALITAAVIVALAAILTAVVAHALASPTMMKMASPPAGISYLDSLRHSIEAQTKFRPYYAGVPGTPAVRDALPGVAALEDNWRAVRAEMDALIGGADAAPSTAPAMTTVYNNVVGGGSRGAATGRFAPARDAVSRWIFGERANTFDAIGQSGWRVANLLIFDREVPGNAARCPETMRLLRGIPGVQSALFSIFAPHTAVPTHADPAAGVIRLHLGLKVPADRSRCFLEVGGIRYHWTEGDTVVFDDALPHRAVNDTDESRAVLFVDIRRDLHGAAALAQRLADWANSRRPGTAIALAASEIV